PPIIERVPPQLVPPRAYASAVPAPPDASSTESGPLAATDATRPELVVQVRPPQVASAKAPAPAGTAGPTGISTGITPITAEAFEILRDKDVVISYLDKQGNLTRRTIVPKRSTTEYGHSAVRAFCRLRGAERTFLLKRIHSAASGDWPSALEAYKAHRKS